MTANEFQQEFRLLLQTDIVTFHYRKKNGKLRKAVGTTCLDFVPTDLLPKGIGSQRPAGYVNYYDLTVCGWRTLRLKHVTSYEVLEPEPTPEPLPRGVESEHQATQADEGNHRSPQRGAFVAERRKNYQLSARPEGALSERSGERTINYQLCKH